jgi:cytochrome c1
VEKIEASQTSMMPPGMIAAMNAEEVKDLIAYLVSGGDPEHGSFRGR